MSARHMRWLQVWSCLAAMTALTTPAAAVGAVPLVHRSPEIRFTPGAPGVGDPYFPLEGNGGFDVLHYDLRLSYLPGIRRLGGTDTITARATQNLSRFHLDLSGLRVGAVLVDGHPARFTRRGPELIVTPPTGLLSGRRFVVRVSYAGRPKTIVGSPIDFGSPYGWMYTRDGAYVACAPDGARTWFPSSDHPSDKASFRFAISVPLSVGVVANGDRVRTTAHGPMHTFVWSQPEPMATYLATLAIGHWQLHPRPTPNGIPQLVAVDPVLADRARKAGVVAMTANITDYWSEVFGPYPFGSTGGILDQAPRSGVVLETQTRPLYPFVPIAGTMAHELAHQWFGDSVSVGQWRDIWLNEGFAVFANWLWTEHQGGKTTWQSGRFFYRLFPPSQPVWHTLVGDPGRRTLFSPAVYIRGGLTLVLLRHRLGDETFFRILRSWATQHRYGNGTTHQFTTLASRLSGRDLGRFFHTWLWTLGKPPVKGW